VRRADPTVRLRALTKLSTLLGEVSAPYKLNKLLSGLT
jgi:hypothetical protein